MKILVPAALRDALAPGLPDDVTALWWHDLEEAKALIPDVDAAWLDLGGVRAIPAIVALGERLQWLSTMAAGIEALDHGQLRARGIVLTNGSSLNSAAVADYALLGLLAAAKRYDAVVRLTDRQVWPQTSPGTGELAGSRALIIGMGHIGRDIAKRLAAFDVAVTGVTRSGRDGTLAADQWRATLGDHDWVILAAPATHETQALIGAAELAAMKSTAWLVNIARGDLIDQPALIAALEAGTIGGAFLDTVTPEPLPPEHPLWRAPNCLLSMHLSGRSQTSMRGAAAALFLKNLAAWRAGTPMTNRVDLDAGY
ncbi:D-2-hydroxyacid dehydrogenase [Sphingobium sufflavum]|uniref:NAD(P)-dependent oxidoreductase n=1 Tax=Sphingobium sufflavum TaxID=1129547 RepID=UPI001F1FCF6C|nr:NAD(P)-dependent oxidoreductase [Sphingobium sufflavum]MCE7795206.1 D-2-hydroxyacid dehydrogenase [Sphingobium sufflavum]